MNSDNSYENYSGNIPVNSDNSSENYIEEMCNCCKHQSLYLLPLQVSAFLLSLTKSCAVNSEVLVGEFIE